MSQYSTQTEVSISNSRTENESDRSDGTPGAAGRAPGDAQSRQGSAASGRNVSRFWCFTLNNYDEAVFAQYKELHESGIAKGLILGKEVGASGTRHIQGCVRFNQPRSFNWVRETLRCRITDATPHVEAARNPSAAMDYCKKDGDYIELGETGAKQGKRTDLEEACRELLESKDINQFKEDYPHIYVKYYKGLSALITHGPRKVGEKPLVIWCTGGTGTGKTRWVWDNYPHEQIWPAHNTLKWFDGYEGQPIALFDDFRGHWCQFSFLLTILDRYRIKVPFKGGFCWWCPSTIIITSIHRPEQVYQVIGEDMNQLLRRIDEIKEFPLPVENPQDEAQSQYSLSQTTQNE